jgi:hypothetical protein
MLVSQGLLPKVKKNGKDLIKRKETLIKLVDNYGYREGQTV